MVLGSQNCGGKYEIQQSTKSAINDSCKRRCTIVASAPMIWQDCFLHVWSGVFPSYLQNHPTAKQNGCDMSYACQHWLWAARSAGEKMRASQSHADRVQICWIKKKHIMPLNTKWYCNVCPLSQKTLQDCNNLIEVIEHSHVQWNDHKFIHFPKMRLEAQQLQFCWQSNYCY